MQVAAPKEFALFVLSCMTCLRSGFRGTCASWHIRNLLEGSWLDSFSDRGGQGFERNKKHGLGAHQIEVSTAGLSIVHFIS
jgi:hypothetical protein